MIVKARKLIKEEMNEEMIKLDAEMKQANGVPDR
jgi:hypothetical protein